MNIDPIGKIYPSILPYYDKSMKKTIYKSRPVLILAEPVGFDTEYNVLPVASISKPIFYNAEYDIKLDPEIYNLLCLKRVSYVRTHKQTLVYKSLIDFDKCIGDLKGDYTELFYEILEKLDKFNSNLKEGCMSITL